MLVASERDQQHMVAMVSTNAATQTEDQALRTITTVIPSIKTYPELNSVVDVRPYAAVAAGTRYLSQTEEYKELSPPLRPTASSLVRLRPPRLRTRALANHPHHRALENKLGLLVSELQL